MGSPLTGAHVGCLAALTEDVLYAASIAQGCPDAFWAARSRGDRLDPSRATRGCATVVSTLGSTPSIKVVRRTAPAEAWAAQLHPTGHLETRGDQTGRSSVEPDEAARPPPSTSPTRTAPRGPARFLQRSSRVLGVPDKGDSGRAFYLPISPSGLPPLLALLHVSGPSTPLSSHGSRPECASAPPASRILYRQARDHRQLTPPRGGRRKTPPQSQITDKCATSAMRVAEGHREDAP